MISRREHRIGHPRVLAVVAMALLVASLARAQSASAQAPYWKISSRSAPAILPVAGEQLLGEHAERVKGEGMIIATATNLGDANANGTSAHITVTDQLPAGLEAIKVRGEVGAGVPPGNGHSVELSCPPTFTDNRVECTFENEVPPYGYLEVRISVRVLTATPEEPLNEITLTGGEPKQEGELAEEQDKLGEPVKIGGAGGKTPFGVEAYELAPENENGSLDTEAGSHPFQLTTTFDLNQAYGFYEEQAEALPQAPALQKDLTFKLPPGLIGNPTAVPQCSGVDFGALAPGSTNLCPDSTAIGVASVTFNDPILFGMQTWSVPVFNLVPTSGEPAKFGFSFLHTPVILDTSVRTGEGYGVTVTVDKAPEAIQVLGAQVTLWGVPGDPRHDHSRGWNCLDSGSWVEEIHPTPECVLDEFSHPSPFLLLPTSCTSPLATTVTGDSWSGETLQASNEPPWARKPPVALTGCEKLPFHPSIEVKAEERATSTPTGGTVEVNLPQSTTLEAGGEAEADIKDTTLELPVGVQASAGAANGLATCSVREVGFFGRLDELTAAGEEELERESSAGEVLESELATQGFTPVRASCPDASKVGSVEIKTPLLPEPLRGSVYLGRQDTDPFASPLVLYLEAIEENPVTKEGSKVLVKLAGEVKIEEGTGRLTSTFANTPPVPFEHLKVHLFGGPRATQATPAFCREPDGRPYQAEALFTSWSKPQRGSEVKTESSPEEFSGPCPGAPLPFAPSFVAGATDTQAAAFSPFSLTIRRPDGDQALNALTVNLPEGAAAVLADVTPCKEPAPGEAWNCGPESLIGESTASSGLGGDPYTLGGQVYLTQGYDGAPFGILDATLAKAGPFNLGWVYVRSRINVNPETTAVTVTTDAGPHNDAFLTMLKGVPVQLKQINVLINRPEFEFNPSNCTPTAVTGTLGASEGASVGVSSEFGVTNCASLPFNPTLTATAGGQASKADGASLNVKITSAGLGQANIHKVDLTIPKVLPSRLSTINQACPDATFLANPAACDEGSVIGSATVHTPVLKSPLTGPAYLVSHGGEAFPDVEFVLQGEGITVILDGRTYIHEGITYSKFETAPDAPFTSFETELPTGPHSILTAYVPASENYSLCKQTVLIPTEITAQDGAVIKQTTTVALNGCRGVASYKVSRAQELAKALKACKKDKHKRKRLACEKAARKKYGPKAAKRSKKTKKK